MKFADTIEYRTRLTVGLSLKAETKGAGGQLCSEKARPKEFGGSKCTMGPCRLLYTIKPGSTKVLSAGEKKK